MRLAVWKPPDQESPLPIGRVQLSGRRLVGGDGFHFSMGQRLTIGRSEQSLNIVAGTHREVNICALDRAQGIHIFDGVEKLVRVREISCPRSLPFPLNNVGSSGKSNTSKRPSASVSSTG